MTEPTDAELEAFAVEEQFLLFCDVDEFTQIARAVLAKWGTPPAGAGVPVAFLVCTEEGDPDMVFLNRHEAQQYLEDHEQPIPLYTTPQPTQAQAGAVPLTREQITAAAKKLAECMDYPWDHMPEQGRAEMRKHARAVIAAANGSPPPTA